MPQFKFNIRTTSICLLLCLCFLRLSYWQYQRYYQKLSLIKELTQRLYEPIVPFNTFLTNKDSILFKDYWDKNKLLHKRITLEGEYDFEHEIIIKNRRFKGTAGSLIITPLRIQLSSDFNLNNINNTDINTNKDPQSAVYVLVNRGFVPFEDARGPTRLKYQKNKLESLTGFIKEDSPKRLFAPSDDDSGIDKRWVDEWLRVDIQNIKKQLPYIVLPIYIEKILPETNPNDLAENLINKTEEKSEMLSMVSQRAVPKLGISEDQLPYPLPDTYVSPGRHYEYIWEWSIMAVGVLIIGGILQLKR